MDLDKFMEDMGTLEDEEFGAPKKKEDMLREKSRVYSAKVA